MAGPFPDRAERAKSLEPQDFVRRLEVRGPAAMPQLFHRTLRYWLLCLLAFFALSAVAQPAPRPPSSHLSAAVRMMEAMGFREDLAAPARRWVAELQGHDHAGAERMRAITEPFFTADEVYGQLAPFMARLISEDACLAIAGFWEGSAGLKLRQAQRMLLSGNRPPPPAFTADEQRSIREFEQSSAFAQLKAANPLIRQELQAYSSQLQQRMREAAAGK